MDKIYDIEQYKALIAYAKRMGYQATNCYFLVAEVRQKIETGLLYYLQMKDGLLLFVDCGSFFRCYYYLSENGYPEIVNLEKDAVIEFPFSSAINEKQLDQVKMLEKMGFCLGRESAMMRVTADSVKTGLPIGNNCSLAVESDSDRIMDMLYMTFNSLYAFLPTKAELILDIREDKVFVLRHEKDIAGVLLSGKDKKNATIKQIVIDPAFRCKGYGTLLLDFYHRHYKTDVVAFHHWVDIRNTSAVSLYRKFGYDFTSRKANEYIKLIGG